MQRRVPQGFVDTWDAWLQECLYVSRQQLGEQWLDLYLTSPVWRFVLAEGICGESAYAGVMLPSVDRVGRYFPLTLVAPLETGTCILEAACGTGRAWFDAAEELALRALDATDLDLQAFDADVDALQGLAGYAGLALSNQLMGLLGQSGFARSGSSWHISMPGETPQSAANAFASLELQRTFRPCGLWWTQGSQAVQPGWLVTTGLPTPTAYVAMLSGQWRRAGWNSVELAMQVPQSVVAPAEATATEVPRPRDVQIAAAHPPSPRGQSASTEIRYIVRPEAGLWGLATAAAGGRDSGARADLISDVAHDLAPQATLTTRIESARRALHGALSARAGTIGGSPEGVAVILFLAEQTECALLWSGAARAIRIRNGTATELLAGERPTGAETAGDAAAAPRFDGGGADGGLLALLATPAEAGPAVGVRYQELEANDLWVLGIEGSVPEALIARLVSTWPGRAPAADEACDPNAAAGLDGVLDSVLAQDDPLVAADTPALLLIAAQLAERPAA